MEEQFNNQCDLVNHMKVGKRWVFATIFFKEWGTEIGREKGGIEKNTYFER